MCKTLVRDVPRRDPGAAVHVAALTEHRTVDVTLVGP